MFKEVSTKKLHKPVVSDFFLVYWEEQKQIVNFHHHHKKLHPFKK